MKKKVKLDDVDVVVDPTPLTDEEKKFISDYIQKAKVKLNKKIVKHKK